MNVALNRQTTLGPLTERQGGIERYLHVPSPGRLNYIPQHFASLCWAISGGALVQKFHENRNANP